MLIIERNLDGIRNSFPKGGHNISKIDGVATLNYRPQISST
jgi:hypothetical protein